MSGGRFDYKQHHIEDIARDIQSLIDHNDTDTIDEDGNSFVLGFPLQVLEKFVEAVKLLRTAGIYAHRIDWLVSGDDGEETFLEKLEEDLQREVNVESKIEESDLVKALRSELRLVKGQRDTYAACVDRLEDKLRSLKKEICAFKDMSDDLFDA